LTDEFIFSTIRAMARKPRVQYPGAMYHVMNRGDRREAIFADGEDRRRFLKTLGEACQKTCWPVHAYCLMSNHFHLVLETPQPNLVAGMNWLQGTYTSRFNRRHKEFGHLFSGGYQALPVDGRGTGYLKRACDYVHLNPARAKWLRPEQPLESFRWSSYPGTSVVSKQRPLSRPFLDPRSAPRRPTSAALNSTQKAATLRSCGAASKPLLFCSPPDWPLPWPGSFSLFAILENPLTRVAP
jgi:REP element-mobilizing transposase RayT